MRFMRRSEVPPARVGQISVPHFEPEESVAINCSARRAVLSDGSIFPITNFFDADGDEVSDAADAVRFVAGSDVRGRWWAGDLSAFGADRN